MSVRKSMIGIEPSQGTHRPVPKESKAMTLKKGRIGPAATWSCLVIGQELKHRFRVRGASYSLSLAKSHHRILTSHTPQRTPEISFQRRGVNFDGPGSRYTTFRFGYSRNDDAIRCSWKIT